MLRRGSSGSCCSSAWSPAHVLVATGGAGQCFAVTTNPALSTGDGIAHGPARRRRGRRPRVHAVPPDRAAPPVDAAPAALRGAARRRRGPARRARRRLHGRRAPARRPRARATSSPRAISRRLHRARPRPPLARRHRRSTTSRSGSRRSGRRAEPSGSTPRSDWLPVAPAAHYLSGGVVHRPRRRDDARPGCGRAARRRAAACTAPTAWRRTRCSTGSCSRARVGRGDHRRARTAPEPTGRARAAIAARVGPRRVRSPVRPRPGAVDPRGAAAGDDRATPACVRSADEPRARRGSRSRDADAPRTSRPRTSSR